MCVGRNAVPVLNLPEYRQDIQWWHNLKKVIVMAELTIPFDTVLEGARERKEAKYDHLRVTAVRNGYRASLITLEIGSQLPRCASYARF